MKNLTRPHGFEKLTVSGTLPAGLDGTLYRAAPALFSRGSTRVVHRFEADGALIGTRFDGGEVSGGVRYIESEAYLREEKAGRILTGSAAPWWRRTLDMVRGRIKNSGNTSVMAWNDRLFALMEAGIPVEMSPDDLKTVGETNLGVVPAAFSAHPHRHASGALYNFGVRYGRQSYIDLFRLDKTAQHFGSVPMPWATMLHDFALTEKAMVFLIGPAPMDMLGALLGKDITTVFEWTPSLGAQILYVPLHDPSAFKTFEIESAWVWHVARGFEEGDTTVFDVVEYPDLDSLGAIGDGSRVIEPPRLVRYRMNHSTGTTERHLLWDAIVEFPTLRNNATHADAPIFTHLSHDPMGTKNPRQGVARFTVKNGTDRFAFPPGVRVDEPVFAMTDEGGAILQLTQPPEGNAEIAVFRADHLSDGPQARVRFDQPLPQSYHGLFVPN